MINLKNISKFYNLNDEKIDVLQNINLDINRGDFLTIMGPSGSGKSTLMNIIGCLDPSSDGNYFYEGVDVLGFSDKEVAKFRNNTIGFVFQQFNLLPRLSALDNVELPMVYAGVHKKDRTVRAKIALESVGLKDRIHHFPNELSGGQKQRVAIARAIINTPSLIIADEPTGALDSLTGKNIMEIFKQLNSKGSTIIVVTHEKEMCKYGTRSILIRDGRIVSSLENKSNTAENF